MWARGFPARFYIYIIQVHIGFRVQLLRLAIYEGIWDLGMGFSLGSCRYCARALPLAKMASTQAVQIDDRAVLNKHE